MDAFASGLLSTIRTTSMNVFNRCKSLIQRSLGTLPITSFSKCTSKVFDIKPNGLTRCTWCRMKKPITKTSDVQPGDHITFTRRPFYDHHAIVIAIKDKTVTVIEAAPEIKESSYKIKFNNKFQKIWYTSPKFTPNQIVKRARQKLESSEYNFFTNNCEHFATWCVTGVKFSDQILEAFTGDGFPDVLNISDVTQMYTQAQLCKSCYIRILQITIQPEMRNIRPQNVHQGDIITFSYYMIWHDAVVLEVDEDRITLIHYGTNNVVTRTILKEIIDFSEKDILLWDFSDWCVFPTDEVVARATDRLGEEKWNLKNNRAVHFARSCKIRVPQWYFQFVPADHPENQSIFVGNMSIVNADEITTDSRCNPVSNRTLTNSTDNMMARHTEKLETDKEITVQEEDYESKEKELLDSLAMLDLSTMNLDPLHDPHAMEEKTEITVRKGSKKITKRHKNVELESTL